MMTRVNIDKEEYQKLRSTLKKLLKPVSNLDFSVVIEMVTDTKFEKLSKSNTDLDLLDCIKRSANSLMTQVFEQPLFGARPNDVSQPLERQLKRYLQDEEIEIITPKGSGYPDVILKDKYNRVTYLEVKVSRVENISEASARNFFYKVSSRTKVIYDGRHLLLGFAIEEDKENVRHWRTVFWKLVDLYNLKVSLKPEFNANNVAIYDSNNIVAKNAINSDYRQYL